MKTEVELVGYVEDGDKPTGAQFKEIIESARHYWLDYAYFGVALVAEIPTVTNRNIFYLATTPGTYTEFNNLIVNAGELAVLKFTVNPSTGIGVWSKDSLGYYGAAITEVYGLALLQSDGGTGTLPAAIDLKCVSGALTPTYQWQSKATTSATWTNITGQTAATLTFDKDSAIWGGVNTVLIRCIVTDANSIIYYSNAINCNTLV